MCQKTPYLKFFYLKYKEEMRSRLISPPCKDTLSATEHQFSDLIIKSWRVIIKINSSMGKYTFLVAKLMKKKVRIMSQRHERIKYESRGLRH